MESPRNRKLQLSGNDFLPKLNGTEVENIPKDISFYIDDLQNIHPSLSAISFDNSEKVRTITLMTSYINLAAWIRPFSFDEYISEVEKLIEGLVLPIARYNDPNSVKLINHTILGFKFYVNHGDLTEKISNYLKIISLAQLEAERLLRKQNLSNNECIARNVIFLEGEKCHFEENLTIEFKEVKGENPVGSIQSMVNEYVLAFLNSQGGSVFWGINDDGIVVSLRLNSKLKDDIRKAINNKINLIDPLIDPTRIGVFFHETVNIVDGYVLEVSVPRSDSNLLYFNSSGETWVRLNGCKKKLQGSALQDYIIQRLQKKT